MKVSRLLISGASSSVGKTLITAGLALELRSRGLGVTICQTRANSAEAALLRRVSGRLVRTIDPSLLAADQILNTVEQAGVGADVVLIDGSEGVFDGRGFGTRAGSDGDLAALLQTPSLLVVDVRNLGATIAAVVRGVQSLASGFEFVGTALNRVAHRDSALTPELRDREFYEAAFREFQLPAALGGVAEADFEIPEIPKGVTEEGVSVSLPRSFLPALKGLVAQSLNVDEVLLRCAQVPSLTLSGSLRKRSIGARARIAYAEDPCFAPGFQDNLEWLRYFGAELVPFSPVADRALPDRIQGIYLTGAAVWRYGAELVQNTAMQESLRSFVLSGAPVYAEGGGAAWLTRRLQGSEEILPGIGVFEGAAIYSEEAPSLCEASFLQDTFVGLAGDLLKGASTNSWQLLRDAPGLRALRLQGRGRVAMEGYLPLPNLFATFAFWHFGSNPECALSFVEEAAATTAR